MKYGLVCPKCRSLNIESWHNGGRAKARCLDCLWHGLFKSLIYWEEVK